MEHHHYKDRPCQIGVGLKIGYLRVYVNFAEGVLGQSWMGTLIQNSLYWYQWDYLRSPATNVFFAGYLPSGNLT